MPSLEGAKVVVAGGAGGVGEGIVRALLAHGARVLATSRSEEKLEGLRTYCRDVTTGELKTLVGDLGDEESARALQHRSTRSSVSSTWRSPRSAAGGRGSP